MPNPFNPLEWVRLAQDWFRRTERSSGFRPYLIFILMLFGFCLVLIALFPTHPMTAETVPFLLKLAVGAFIVFFGLKAIQDPDFCRSEKHVETVKRIAVAEQMGDAGPRILGNELPAVEKPKLLRGQDGDRDGGRQ